LTRSEWLSSYQVQQFLKSLNCEITTSVDGEHVDVYNPQSEKLITIKSKGTIPPFEITMIMSTLGLKY